MVAVWALSSVVLWLFGFYLIAKDWSGQSAARNIFRLFLLFSLSVFYAYYLILKVELDTEPDGVSGSIRGDR